MIFLGFCIEDQHWIKTLIGKRTRKTRVKAEKNGGMKQNLRYVRFF